MPMKQPYTDMGEKGETGEKEPKGAKASDATGEKSVKVPKADSEKGIKGETGEREPSGVKASDRGGEEKKRIIGGVGMGMKDSLSREGMGSKERGEHNTGRSEKEIYSHKRHG